MSTELPDPRRYGAAGAASAAPTPALRASLAAGSDAGITRALSAAPDATAYRAIWESICNAVHERAADPEDVTTRLYAVPLIIVAGATRAGVIAGALSDAGVVTGLFEQHGALGKSRNFGFSNALCSLDTLERMRPSQIFQWTHGAAEPPRDLVPEPIAIEEPGESVHLRFLVGAAIVPASEPSFVETGSNIGAWGMAVTRALAAELGQIGIEVLPLPRQPLDLLRAAHAGRRAQLETALDLFMSNALRRYRTAIGDPSAVLSSHEDGDVRVTLSSPFIEDAVDGYRWPLHPLDDLAGVTRTVLALLAECRVTDVSIVPRVLPAHNAHGTVWFPRPGEVEGAALPH